MRFSSLSQWLDWQKTSHVRTIDLNLDRVEIVYARIAVAYHPFTITVSGTNGKGSTIAFLDSILRQQGYRVGTYTSPHIVNYNERIRINGSPVDDASICSAFERIDAVRDDISLSFFEFGTLAALDIFSRNRVDVQLLEVGLGGRLDAVNVVDADIPIVTNISIDHVFWLGKTRDEISLEKAGVMRSGVAAVVGDPDPPQALLKWTEKNSVPVSLLNREYRFECNPDSWSWYGTAQQYTHLPLPGLRGPHQFQNVAAVLQALSLISDKLPVSEQSIRDGVEQVVLPGRFQYIGSKSGTDSEPAVLIDVAHNPHSAALLVQNIQQHYPGRRLLALFSVMADKDIAIIVDHMKDLVEKWYPVPLEIERAASTDEIIAVLSHCGVENYSKQLQNFDEAWNAAAEDITNSQDIILIFGSFFLVSEYFQRHLTHLVTGSARGTET
jgi:dihydrofolate synthase/folylpolyglutamate synthase